MMEKQNCDKSYYVVMNESKAGNQRLKTLFKEQFQIPSERAILETFTKKEILKHLCIKDDVKDHMDSIEKIVEKLAPNTAVFFDETSIVRGNGKVDWSNLNTVFTLTPVFFLFSNTLPLFYVILLVYKMRKKRE